MSNHPSQKGSTVLYNHNFSNPLVTENVPLSFIGTICPTIRHKKVLQSCTITISPTHPLQKTFHCPVQSHYLYPPCHKTTLCRPPTVALPNLVTAYCSLQLRFIATIEPSVVGFESLSTAFLKLFSSGDHFH